MNLHAAQIHALRLAIQSLQTDRRRNYAAGEHAWRQGVRAERVNKEKVKGDLFVFAEEGHKRYAELTEAIQQLEDLIEILTDPGTTTDQPALFP